MSISVKERDFDETRSVRSHRSQPRGYQTVHRYRYPGTLPDEEVEDETMRVVIREKDNGRDERENINIKISDRELDRGRNHRDTYRIVRRVSRERSSRSSSSSSSSSESERHTVKSARSPYTLEKYSKSTEYFSRPEPQNIYIKQEAARPVIIQRDAPQQIIIREEARPQQVIVRREPAYQMAQRNDDRGSYDEDDYYYERRVREVDGRGRRRDDLKDRFGGRERHRHGQGDRDYWSDDDAVLIRRERSSSYGSRDRSKSRRRIAEGALAGVAAAEIVRHHRKEEGKRPGSHIGQVVGYGALGGIGAGVLDRIARSRSRSRSRSWERAFRGRGRGYRDRSRSRSGSRNRSITRTQALAGVAALAGLGALAYAAGRNNAPKNQTTIVEGADRRSRSRRRRSSVVVPSEPLGSPHSATNPEHRNRVVSKAGLAGAALAGLYEARKRSKSGRRSKSRLREGVPIVAAGLGTAAVAAAWEKTKANREEKKARSQSRSGSVVAEDGALVSYGGDPIYSDRGRRRSSRGRRRHSRSRSRSSSGSSDRHQSRSRSRSRGKHIAEAAGVAAVAGVAAHEAGKRRERRRAEKERKRQDEEQAASYDHRPYSPAQEAHPYHYPASNSFPPPPVSGYGNEAGYLPPNHQHPNYVEPAYGGAQPAPYNPAQWGPTNGPTLPREEPGYGDHGRHPSPSGHYADRRSGTPGPENVSEPYRGAHATRDVSPYGVVNQDGRSHRPEDRSTGVLNSTNDRNVKFANSDAHDAGSSPKPAEDMTPKASRSRRNRVNDESNGKRDGVHSGTRRRRRHRREPNSSRSEPPVSRVKSPTESADSGSTIEEPDLVNRFDENGKERKQSRGPTNFFDRMESMAEDWVNKKRGKGTT